MDFFEFNGKPFVNINGKDYFLLRGYGRSWKNFLFVQVSGATPLRKEDLPSKSWDLLVSKVGKTRIYTAYLKSYFNYETTRDSFTLGFVGASTAGSFFLALYFLNRRYSLSVPLLNMDALAKEYAEGNVSNYHFTTEPDKGISHAKMVVLEANYSLDENDARRIMTM